MKNALAFVFLSLGFVLLHGCGKPEAPGTSTGKAGTADAAPKSIVVGHPVCLSGKHAKAGEQAYGGILACIEWVNTVYGGVQVNGTKVPLEYKYYDCESKKESVTSLLERLITTDKVSAIIAPYSSGLTLAGAPVAEKHGALYLDHGGAGDEIFKQGFTLIVQTIGPGSRYHVGTLDMLHQKDPGAKRLALAYEDDEFARTVKAGAEEHATKLGYEIVFNQTYPKGASDLTPMLSAMKATNPDLFLGGGHFEDGQLLNSQMADLNINVKAMSLIAAATLPAFHEALGEKAAGVMGPSHWEYGVTFAKETATKAGETWFGPGQDEFVTLFKQAMKKDIAPDYHAAEAGAAILSLVLGIEKANSLESSAIRKALGELKFTSFYGSWAIDQTGLQVGHSMVDVQWQKGERKIVWPESAKTADLLYPKAAFGK